MSRKDQSIVAKIIRKVQQNPILYDYNLEEFKDINRKNLLWETIAQEVGAKNGDAVYWKFKNLRDSYSKYKKHQVSPPIFLHGAKKSLANWRWASAMAFLDPFMRKTKEFHANENEESDDSEQPVEETKVKCRDSSDDCHESSNADFTTTGELATNSGENELEAHSIEKKRKYVHERARDDSFQVESSSDKLDKVDYLFLSYADTFKRLSRKRQALLKLKMAKIFAIAELEELEGEPINLQMAAKQMAADSD